MAKKIDIAGTLNAATTDGVLGFSEQIKDESKGKMQSSLNKEFGEGIERIERKSDIAYNAVKTLEGLSNANEAMQTLAGQVVQIEENKQNIASNKADADSKLTELGSEVGELSIEVFGSDEPLIYQCALYQGSPTNKNSQGSSYYIIPIKSNSVVTIVGNYVNGTYYTVLSDFDYSKTAPCTLASGYDSYTNNAPGQGIVRNLEIPSDAKYLMVTNLWVDVDKLPQSVLIDGVELLENAIGINERLNYLKQEVRQEIEAINEDIKLADTRIDSVEQKFNNSEALINDKNLYKGTVANPNLTANSFYCLPIKGGDSVKIIMEATGGYYTVLANFDKTQMPTGDLATGYDSYMIFVSRGTTTEFIAPEDALYLAITNIYTGQNILPIEILINGHSAFAPKLGIENKVTTIENKVTTIEEKLSEIGNVDISQAVDALRLEVVELCDKKKVLEDSIESLVGVKYKDGESSVLSNVSEGKMIVNIHKRTNNGLYGDYNDIFLTDVRDDFSDLVFKDEKNTILPSFKICGGNYDILPDSRIPRSSLIYKNSRNQLFSASGGGIYKSEDNGETWNLYHIGGLDNSSTRVAWIDSYDNLFFGADGKLCRSEYPYTTASVVLDTNDVTDFNNLNPNGTVLEKFPIAPVILSSCMTERNGILYFSRYQSERFVGIYKSVDNGLTWTLDYYRFDYQHVHALFYNKDTDTIYAGLDGGNAILKNVSSNGWVLLNDTTEVPKAADYGVIFSENGKRFIGGETSIVGGGSLFITEDDVNFREVLSNGHSVYYVKRLGNMLFCGCLASGAWQSSSIYCSNDNGETWRVAWTSGRRYSNTTSAGPRYISKIDGLEELFVSGTNGITPMRILEGGNNYSASFLVEVPVSCKSITAESGYIISEQSILSNDYIPSKSVVYFCFNEGLGYVIERIGGNIYQGNYRWYKGGRNLFDITPRIASCGDSDSLIVDFSGGFDLGELDLSNGYHIGFWCKSSNGNTIDLIDIGGNKLTAKDYRLYVDGVNTHTLIYPMVTKMDRFDISVDSNGVMTLYHNGELIYDNVDASSTLKKGKVKILNATQYNGDFTIQHYSISLYPCTQDDAIKFYYGGVVDLYTL